MTILMRDNLYQATRVLNSAHAGLLMQRGLYKWEEGEKPIKKALINTIASVKPNELYLLAFNRWLGTTFDKPTFATVSAKIDGRLFTGLALGGTLETGAMTHHTYGMPMIAGSSIKGAVRNYAEHLFAKRDEHNQIKYDEDGQVIVQDNKKSILDILFGTDSDDENANAGYLIWHDAWWIPKVTSNMQLLSDNQPFVGDVVTVHHQKYYQGEWSEALDMENPVPNQQIAIQGDFYFCIEGDENWVKFAKQLLQNMLNEQGLGAKGSNGYGYFTQSKALTPFLEYLQQEQAQQQAIKEQAKIQQAILNLSENQQLVYLFKVELSKKDPNQWHGKVGSPPQVVINGENYDFLELFKAVQTWDNPEDQKYALEQVFLPELPKLLGSAISKNKNWKERINPLKEKLGLT